ncbi:MAG: hypothetical protein VX755_09050 [Pseudomonadota bacterium]|nr:hypothetical protein [Pseudomonadota bacterium]MED5536490.1 hypothetical protein [Pseudomonadota bacterium]
MNLERLNALLPSRLTIAAVVGCLVFIPLSMALAWSAGVAEHDRRRVQTEADALKAQITAPATGYIARLATCETSLSGTQASIQLQNAAVETLRSAAADAAARADRLVQVAQAQASAAERRARTVLQSQPREGESRCEAAFRLHQEALP